jgi:hypothetical protein
MPTGLRELFQVPLLVWILAIPLIFVLASPTSPQIRRWIPGGLLAAVAWLMLATTLLVFPEAVAKEWSHLEADRYSVGAWLWFIFVGLLGRIYVFLCSLSIVRDYHWPQRNAPPCDS